MVKMKITDEELEKSMEKVNRLLRWDPVEDLILNEQDIFVEFVNKEECRGLLGGLIDWLKTPEEEREEFLEDLNNGPLFGK